MIISQHEVEFRKDGSVHDQTQVTALLDGLGGAAEFLVLSHGWNNDKDDANRTYTHFLNSLAQVRDATTSPALAVMKIFWPSKRFSTDDLIPGGAASSDSDEALRTALAALRHDPDRLGETAEDPIRAANIDQASALVDDLETSEPARRAYVLCMRSILNPDEAHADDGSTDFFQRDPLELFDALREEIPVTLPVGAGGVAGVSGGGVAFLGDLVSGAKAAARRLANYASYYQMKTRAGTVGRTGVASVLQRVRERFPQLPVHLAGHSFGGRLVTAAAATIDPGGAPVTMSLLQAAFSHNGLSRAFDGTNDGAFRPVLAQSRISGPIVVTHTRHDVAVGIAYPLASRVARDNAAAIGDANDPYGGMGRNGAQHTPEVSRDEDRIRAVGSGYGFRPGHVYNLNADEFVADHGDVTNPAVVNAVVAVMSARAPSVLG